MKRWLAPLLMLVCLPGCKGVGFSSLDQPGFDAPSPEEKEDAKFWNQFYGRPQSSDESSE